MTTDTGNFTQDNLKRNSDFNPVEDVKQDFDSSPSLLRTRKNLVVKGSFRADGIELSSPKGRRIAVTRANSVYTATPTDTLIVVPSVAVAPTITLPLASVAGIGKVYMVKDISGSALSTSITISRSGTDTINGETATAINTNYGLISLFTDGDNWFVQ